ncbi:hypothetical protein ACIRD8_28630 [Streptomyces sp. NPDC102451]|uniref:hypothetical protein n=1 Tax=Streptomyces sp. NPDC102451 TaxID=3366177 RepID=UPI003806B788
MNFAITADEVRTVFGLTGVVHFPRYDVPHNRVNDRAALLLSTVGLPDALPFADEDSQWNLAFEEVIDGVW